jgi:hypothetical protein
MEPLPVIEGADAVPSGPWSRRPESGRLCHGTGAHCRHAGTGNDVLHDESGERLSVRTPKGAPHYFALVERSGSPEDREIEIGPLLVGWDTQ